MDMTTEAPVSEPTISEQVYGLITKTLNDIRSTSITSTSLVVDVLLDLQNLFMEWEVKASDAINNSQGDAE